MNVGSSMRLYCCACALGRINRPKSAVLMQPTRLHFYAARLNAQNSRANLLRRLLVPEYAKFFPNRACALLIVRSFAAIDAPDGQIPGARTTGYNPKGKIPKPALEIRGGKGYSEFGHNDKKHEARVGLESIRNASCIIVIVLAFIGFFNWNA